MTVEPQQLRDLLATAAGVLDSASAQFVAGHRADSAVEKKGNDFATEVDLAIERRVVAELTRLTGIGVHGEDASDDRATRRALCARATQPQSHRGVGWGYQ